MKIKRMFLLFTQRRRNGTLLSTNLSFVSTLSRMLTSKDVNVKAENRDYVRRKVQY